MNKSIDKVIKKEIALLTPKEAAELLNVRENTLRSWRCTKKEQVPYIKIGSKVMYREDDLVAWLNSKRVSAA